MGCTTKDEEFGVTTLVTSRFILVQRHMTRLNARTMGSRQASHLLHQLEAVVVLWVKGSWSPGRFASALRTSLSS